MRAESIAALVQRRHVRGDHLVLRRVSAPSLKWSLDAASIAVRKSGRRLIVRRMSGTILATLRDLDAAYSSASGPSASASLTILMRAIDRSNARSRSGVTSAAGRPRTSAASADPARRPDLSDLQRIALERASMRGTHLDHVRPRVHRASLTLLL